MANLIDDVKNSLSSLISGAGDVVSTAQNVAKENVVKAVSGVGNVTKTGTKAV